jgi:adenylylsulfate kinase
MTPPPPSTAEGFCLWLTGLPSAGKTSLANALVPRLTERGLEVELLDGDEVRRGLSSDLGFDRKSRESHARRVAYVAKVLARHRTVALVALISPYRTSRDEARQAIGRFVEVYVATPLEVCIQRDPKGLYRRALAGEIREMTGVDDPYEPPTAPEVRVDASRGSPDELADFVIRELERGGWLPRS